MAGFADLVDTADAPTVAASPRKASSFSALIDQPSAPSRPKVSKAAAPSSDVRGGTLLEQSPQTQANVLADSKGAKDATFNGMPLDAATRSMPARPPAQPTAPAPASGQPRTGADAVPTSSDPAIDAANWQATLAARAQEPAPPKWYDKARAVGEATANTLASLTGRPPSPVSPLGQEYTQNVSDFMSTHGPSMVGIGPELGTLGEIMSYRPAAVVGRAAPRSAPPAPPATSSMPTGAAPTLAQASPEIQAAVKEAGLPADHPAVSRYVTADTLPVPQKITRGQAAGDPTMISEEMNSRGKGQAAPVSPDFYKAQGKGVAENMDAIRASAAPDIPASANMVDHGQTLLDAYKTKDAAVTADISAKYKALSDANGGSLPVNGKDFVASADAALAKQMKGRYVPKEIAADLEGFRQGGPMTFEDFENMRTNLAAEGRKAERAGDGNAAGAINIVRNSLEALPITGETAAVKPLADAARSAAKARFDAIKADPAYKAAVNDPEDLGQPSQAADRFFRANVLNGSREGVARMRANLQDQPQAGQAIAAGTLDHLKAQMNADPTTGNFSSAAYNKALGTLGPKMEQLVDPTTAQQLQAIGEHAKTIQVQPRGSYVNNSNTATALLAEGAKAAATHGTNMLFGGIPVGSAARAVGSRVLDSRSAAKVTRQSTDPRAALTSLSDLMKP